HGRAALPGGSSSTSAFAMVGARPRRVNGLLDGRYFRYHPRTVGFFDRFVGRSKAEGRRAKEARSKELDGDLPAAVDLYQEAGLPDEAARVLLLRADAERSAEKRIALFSLAAYTATSEEIKRRARGRK